MRSGSARARADAVRMDREAAAGGPIVRGFVGSGFRVYDERVFRALLMTVETASEWTPPPLDRLDMFSEDHEDLAAALYADAFPVDADKEGRIVLPEALVAHAGLADSVVFMGLGRIFQIWEPQAAAARRESARQRARGVTLPAAKSGAA